MCYDYSALHYALFFAPIAHLDRAFDFESKGSGFDSCSAHHWWKGHVGLFLSQGCLGRQDGEER